MNLTRLTGGLLILAAALAGCSSSSSAPDTGSDVGTSSDAYRWRKRHNDEEIAQLVFRTDIVSNQPGAKVQDPTLLNAWGLAFNPPRGVAWVSANGSDISEIYNVNGAHVIPSVAVPPGAPTGQVFNPSATAFKGDHFIFVTERGTIAGWQSGTTAVVRVDHSAKGAIYKGVTIEEGCEHPRLYAADFHNNKVEVYDDNYSQILKDSFVDDDIPCDFAPFNVQEVDGLIIVTYAKQDEDKEDDVKGPGNGFVDAFDRDGNLLSRLVSRGPLNSPWGVALAPDDFGRIGGHLLIGNFGDGHINVYDFNHFRDCVFVSFDGQLGDECTNDPLEIDGLWALRFGPGTGGFRSDVLYFTAGPNDEADGVFGSLEAKKNKKSRY